MDIKNSIAYLTAHAEKTPLEIGEAVDVLYQEYDSYEKIAQKIGRSPSFWSTRHRLFQLPKGIRWQIDQGAIGIKQGYQMSRLKNEIDQWILAISIIEEELKVKECEDVVNLVLKQNMSIREALSLSIGVRCDKIQTLLLPLRFDIRLSICKIAWEQCQNWEDLCYQFIRQGIDVDIKEVAHQLEKLASNLRKAGQEDKG